MAVSCTAGGSGAECWAQISVGVKRAFPLAAGLVPSPPSPRHACHYSLTNDAVSVCGSPSLTQAHPWVMAAAPALPAGAAGHSHLARAQPGGTNRRQSQGSLNWSHGCWLRVGFVEEEPAPGHMSCSTGTPGLGLSLGMRWSSSVSWAQSCAASSCPGPMLPLEGWALPGPCLRQPPGAVCPGLAVPQLSLVLAPSALPKGEQRSWLGPAERLAGGSLEAPRCQL